jgi:hypothetical protein
MYVHEGSGSAFRCVVGEGAGRQAGQLSHGRTGAVLAVGPDRIGSFPGDLRPPNW